MTVPPAGKPLMTSGIREGPGTQKAPESFKALRGFKALLRQRGAKGIRQRPTLPHDHSCSTIGAEELNGRVRDGIGCDLLAIATGRWFALTRATRAGVVLARRTFAAVAGATLGGAIVSGKNEMEEEQRENEVLI